MKIDFDFKATHSGHFCSRKRKGKTGVERATIAEGDTWIQRRKTTRKKHGKRKVGKKEKKTKGSGQRQVRKMTKSEKELEALRGWPLKNVVLTQEKKG